MNQKDFPILRKKIHGQRLIYLDNAASSQKPKQVIDALTHFYEHTNANVHRGIHTLSNESTVAYDEAHKKIGAFINADKNEIIFTRGTTDSINMIVSMIAQHIKKGDEIILSELEHHSNLVPWQRLQDRGAVLQFIPVKHDFTLDMDVFDTLLSEKTAVVAVTHVSNVTGTINHIKKICNMGHNAGALVIVDGAQAVPHMHVDVKALDADFYVFSGHKMYGPTGIGVLYAKRTLLQHYDPPQQGGGMINEVTYTTATWARPPEKFEAGTPHIAGAVALGKAVDYMTAIGCNNIHKHETDLVTYALKKLKHIKGLTLYTAQKSAGIISFTLEGIHSHDIAAVLDKKGIAIRAGHHCAMPLMKKWGITGTNRVSFGLYNTTEDVDALIDAINIAQEVFACQE